MENDSVQMEEAIATIKELMKTCVPYSKYYIIGDMAIKAIKALEQKSETVTEFADRCRECGKNRWIPVTEKLPEETGRYLAYIVNKYGIAYIMTCDFLVDSYWTWFPDNSNVSDNVLAWMPLPQSYKAEKKEDENERKADEETSEKADRQTSFR